MKRLAYGQLTDSIDEYIRIEESIVLECLREFVATIVNVFGPRYLRVPNNDDVARLCVLGEECWGVSTICIESGRIVYCLLWTIYRSLSFSNHNSPISSDLWIWHAFFGMPGSLNDINVLNRSPVFDALATENAPPINYLINGREYTMGYYLAHDIYPRWATFVKTIPRPQGLRNNYFAKMKEGRRKDVERAFGILQARFAIVRGPAQYWDENTILNIMISCIIMHNMIIEFEGGPCNIEFDGVDATSFGSVSNEYTTNVAQMFQRLSWIKNGETHSQLQLDLVEHL